MSEKKKPEVTLPGKGVLLGDSTKIFNVMAVAAKALQKAGIHEEKNDYIRKMCSCNSYDEAIKITAEYVEII